MSASQFIPFRCLDCRHEFRAGPGPVIHGHGACPACGGLYVGRLSWYIIQCRASAEATVADKMEAAGHSVLFLHYMVRPKCTNRLSHKQRKSGKVMLGKPVKRPVLPGYIFVGLTPEPDFYSIAKTPGVVTLLTNESGPAALPPSEIDRMRAGADGQGRVEYIEQGANRPILRPGSIVRLRTGPFQGFEGPVERDDGRGLVRATLDIFGRQTPIDAPYEEILVVRMAA